MRSHLLARTLAAVFASVILCPRAFAAHGENCVGINTHLSNNDTYDAVAATGMKWVRIDVNWFQVEPTQGNFDWSEIDRVVNKAASAGLKVFATFGYTPPWGSVENKDGAVGNDVPKPGLYEVGLREAVKHFRGRVAHWGLWNEANLGGFWEGNAQQYVDLIVKPGADAIHAECPECFALGPELATVGDKVNEYLDAALGQAGDKFDIITHHTYHGFPEMDPQAGVFGDSFYNAMDKKRIFSSRMALREALTKYSLTHKDVWMTETGYQCKPPTDSGEMDSQREYIELVLKAEQDRDWYTNTFFYEIEDCDYYDSNCDIGGYGVIRRTGGPDSTWQDNFLFKPAYNAIKDWMAAHPTWCQDSPPTDGGTPDSGAQDAGVKDAGTADGGTVAPTTLYAVRAPAPLNIDGKLDEWNFKYEAPVTSADYVELTGPTTGDSDLSGRVIAMWDDDYLYLGAIITDNVHKNDHIPTEMWMGDSWQTAFDADLDRTVGQYDNDGDTEVGFAVLAGGPSTAQWKAPAGAPSWNPKFMSGKDAQNHLVFEIGIPWAQLPPFSPAAGRMLGFAYLINDDDGTGRKGFIEWSTGIGVGKDPSHFGTLALAGGPCEVDTPCSSEAECSAAQAQCQCGGYWTCNGAHRCEWMCGSPDAGQPDTGTPADVGQDAGPADVTEALDSLSGDEGVPDTGTPDDMGGADDTGVTPDIGTTDGGGGAGYDVQYTPTDAGPGAPIDLTTDSGGCSCSVLSI